MDVDADAAREDVVALAQLEGAHTEMQRGERGRTRGIDGKARAREPERVRDTVGDHIVRTAERRPRGDVVEADGILEVVARSDADEDAGSGRAERRQRYAGILDAVPGLLQHDALLRVHVGRLGVADPEEVRIEGVGVGQLPAPPGDASAKSGRVRAEVVGRPSVRGHLSHRDPAGRHNLGKFVRRLRPRRTAGDTDDRDRFPGPQGVHRDSSAPRRWPDSTRMRAAPSMMPRAISSTCR